MVKRQCRICGREYYDWSGKQRGYCSDRCREIRNRDVRRLPNGYYARREARRRKYGRKKKGA